MSYIFGVTRFPMKLPKLVIRSKKRLGRGHGSGKVKTSGRGTKGQNARSSRPLGFEGGQLSITRRFPFLRGKQRNKSRQEKAFPIFVGKLLQFSHDAVIDREALLKKGLIRDRITVVKIIGKAKVNHAYTVKVACSKASYSAIVAAGGKVVVE